MDCSSHDWAVSKYGIVSLGMRGREDGNYDVMEDDKAELF